MAANGSSRSASIRTSPVSSMETPRTPTRPWARIRSAGERMGREGTAGRSGWSRNTKSAAAAAWCGASCPPPWPRPPAPGPSSRCPLLRAGRTVLRHGPTVASPLDRRQVCRGGPAAHLGATGTVAGIARDRRLGRRPRAGRRQRQRSACGGDRALGGVGRRPRRGTRAGDGEPHHRAAPRARGRR